jgi:succinate-semialdehyde dehydrogenase/glutarate-semialdehyde dehydrogenase
VVGGPVSNNLVAPTLLTAVRDDMPVAQTELFGPVMVMSEFDNLDEAIGSINRGRYGLQGGIFTSSLHSTLVAARELAVGTIIVNGTSSTRADGMPFGGVKESGFGKEGPRYAIREMTVERLVVLMAQQ